MNRNWVYSLFALWIVCSFACTQPKPVANVEVQKENFVFSIKGTDTLSLDKYELTSMSPASKKPVMIFAFGGGFKGGDKADKGYVPYFEFLARNGFVVVSTDYRTTLKNLDPSKVSSPMDFIAALQHAIDTAVEDFYDATGFVINQSSDWNIDVERIVASGSSAGAITVLQAEYDLCNGHELAKRLPAGFMPVRFLMCFLHVGKRCLVPLCYSMATRIKPFLSNKPLWRTSAVYGDRPL